MSGRVTSRQGMDVARIATEMAPGDITSGELLAALHKAWKAGYSAGRVAGYVEGQRHMAETQDLILQAMS